MVDHMRVVSSCTPIISAYTSCTFKIFLLVGIEDKYKKICYNSHILLNQLN